MARSKISGPFPDKVRFKIAGTPYNIAVHWSKRSRRYRITLDGRHGIVLTAPNSGKWADAVAFLASQHDWLAARRDLIACPKIIGDGMYIPLRDTQTLIRATGRIRGRTELEPGEPPVLHVPGTREHIGRRTVDWLKSEAVTALTLHSRVHARNLGVGYTAISVRDQATRWGSCSASGRLSYNWRLIMAPCFVLNYVAAHEVAHLVEMNHSDRFWAHVKRIFPDMQRARTWLGTHGRKLLAYQTDKAFSPYTE